MIELPLEIFFLPKTYKCCQLILIILLKVLGFKKFRAQLPEKFYKEKKHYPDHVIYQEKTLNLEEEEEKRFPFPILLDMNGFNKHRTYHR